MRLTGFFMRYVWADCEICRHVLSTTLEDLSARDTDWLAGSDESGAGGALWGIYDETDEEASFAAAIANWRGEQVASEDLLTETAAAQQQPADCRQEAADSAPVGAAETTDAAADAEVVGPVTADETAAIVSDDAATAAVVLVVGVAARSTNSRVPTWMVKDGNSSYSSASLISRDGLTSLFPGMLHFSSGSRCYWHRLPLYLCIDAATGIDFRLLFWQPCSSLTRRVPAELVDPQVESEYRQRPFQFILLSAFCDGTSRSVSSPEHVTVATACAALHQAHHGSAAPSKQHTMAALHQANSTARQRCTKQTAHHGSTGYS